MVTTEQRSRSEIPVEDRWDRSAIYATLDDWNADIERIRADLPKLAEMQGTLDQGADRLLAALTLEDSIGERLTRVYSYAGLWKDEDNANAEAVAAHDRAVTLSVEASQVSSYL